MLTSLDNRLNYYEHFNVIASSFDVSRKAPKLTGKFQQATKNFKKNERATGFELTPRCSRVNNGKHNYDANHSTDQTTQGAT